MPYTAKEQYGKDGENWYLCHWDLWPELSAMTPDIRHTTYTWHVMLLSQPMNFFIKLTKHGHMALKFKPLSKPYMSYIYTYIEHTHIYQNICERRCNFTNISNSEVDSYRHIHIKTNSPLLNACPLIMTVNPYDKIHSVGLPAITHTQKAITHTHKMLWHTHKML